MIIHRIIQSMWCLLVALAASVPLVTWAMNALPSVENSISSVVMLSQNQIQVEGVLSREDGYAGQVYAVLSLNGADYRPVDQVVSPDAFVLNQSARAVEYQVEFNLQTTPAIDDQLIMTWRNEKGVPLDVDMVFLEDTSPLLAVQDQTRTQYDIGPCRHDNNMQVVFCAYNGEVPSEFVLEWFAGSVFEGKRISEEVVSVVHDDENSFVLATQPLPTEDGLYAYVIRDQDGRQIYQGSSRVGELTIPEFTELSEEETLGLTGLEHKFWLQLLILALGFIGLVIIASLLLVGQKPSRYVYATVVALLLALMGYWYVAQAALYESIDYRQYQYQISYEPYRGDEYVVNFSAYDTYTQTPPLNQELEITYNGTDWEPIISDSVGRWAHSRVISIAPAEENTTAVRVADGCASYYGASDYTYSPYGRFDCAPVPFNEDLGDDDIGCMDPTADNYNPNAIIDSGYCVYTSSMSGCTDPAADNYSEDAIIDDESCVYPSCYWTPSLPDPATYCQTEAYYQTNTCTGESRSVPGLLTRGWSPDIDPSTICVGYSVMQTERCSTVRPAPTRLVYGTGTGPTCIRPQIGFEISTNLVNWTTCDAVGRLQLVRTDQPVYLRSVGGEEIDDWTVDQEAGEIIGSVSEHTRDVSKILFSYPVAKKNYDDVVITGLTREGNSSQQTCDITLLNFEFEEL